MKIIIKTNKNSYTWQPRILINNVKDFILGTAIFTIPMIAILLSDLIIGKLGL